MGSIHSHPPDNKFLVDIFSAYPYIVCVIRSLCKDTYNYITYDSSLTLRTTIPPSRVEMGTRTKAFILRYMDTDTHIIYEVMSGYPPIKGIQYLHKEMLTSRAYYEWKLGSRSACLYIVGDGSHRRTCYNNTPYQHKSRIVQSSVDVCTHFATLMRRCQHQITADQCQHQITADQARESVLSHFNHIVAILNKHLYTVHHLAAYLSFNMVAIENEGHRPLIPIPYIPISEPLEARSSLTTMKRGYSGAPSTWQQDYGNKKHVLDDAYTNYCISNRDYLAKTTLYIQKYISGHRYFS